MTEHPKTWFLTGASRGFGAQWARAVLESGDRLAATARDAASLKPLVDTYGDQVLPLGFDVSDATAVRHAVAEAEAHFGGLDVLVNNAGHMLVGAVEEATDEQIRSQMDTNYFGALWTTRAVLPGMRARGGGRILQVSSLGGVVAYPALGIYHASKWALEAVSQSLAAEVAPFGIHVTLIEPIVFQTGLTANSPQTSPDDTYAHARKALYGGAAHIVPGDLEASGRALLELADTPEPPLRVLFGVGGLEELREEYARRLDGWEQWDRLSRTAHGSAAS
ncbi:SDR family NAD(P)-dependent oxidoreductase [Amycolatopsis rhabdoformis]|uniref:SDR family NAD(P)-dependent oxidoreductase n=1 Tax=Amycolatopsis rhabdoformis TaxID=1448059 RepID=A0ABZ1IAB3_9PSEU|nr:SDR family NAD(P)-dependent oxidoreductase [Amycolatopsis rhabdoformis]WSE31409.1 SDR family NAD(P)-dependent oxidoreductase [Amycolatopsis rhabdoformis]